MSKHMMINGDNHRNRDCETFVCSGNNYATIIGELWVCIKGDNYGNAGGRNLKIDGNNHKQSMALEIVELTVNVKGGQVTAPVIIYSGLRLDIPTITGLDIDEMIDPQFVDNQPDTQTVTLTRVSDDKWQVESQGVVNHLQIGKIKTSRVLQLSYFSGTLRSMPMGGVNFSGATFHSNVTYSGGDQYVYGDMYFS